MHWADVKDTATDLGLWGHLIITAVGLTPTNPLNVCKSGCIFIYPLLLRAHNQRLVCFPVPNRFKDLPSVIKTFNFSVFAANALTAPPYILQCCTMVLCIWHSDRIRERGFHGAFGGKYGRVDKEIHLSLTVHFI